MVKHKPPSRIKYEQNHPVLAIRLTTDLKNVLDNLKGEKAYSVFIKEILMGSIGNINKIAEAKAYKKGYSSAQTKYEITLPCSVCKKPMIILPQDVVHKHMQSTMAGWRHSTCSER